MKEEALLALARAARTRAYAPYSSFAVGAALVNADGAVFTGANIENASFDLTVCAERNALWSAVNAGAAGFTRLAVVADCAPPPVPCGACRQVLAELAPEITVIMGNLQGERRSRTLAELLPEPFTGAGLAGAGPAPDRGAQEELWRLPPALRPVGYVASGFAKPEAIPADYKERLGRVVVDPELEEGLYRLEEEKRIIIIAFLHRSRGYTLKGPRSGREGGIYGIFACRGPMRPNPIAHSVVDLVERQGNVLVVRGLDLIDGTPVLDIKTVLPREAL